MNGKEYDPSGTDGRVVMKPGEGTLIFNNPLRRDEGVYQCFAETGLGTAVTVKVDFRAFCKYLNLIAKTVKKDSLD